MSRYQNQNQYQNQNPYAAYMPSYGTIAADAGESERTTFLRLTYLHLAGAIAAFVGLNAAYFLVVPQEIQNTVLRTIFGGGWSMLILLGGVMLLSGVANYFAQAEGSRPTQYAGLGLYILLQTVVFLPILTFAMRTSPAAIPAAALITGVLFSGLTLLVLTTKIDLTGYGGYLAAAGLATFGVIIASWFFGFQLGIFFSGAMVLLAAGYILYDTSNVLHRYRTTQYVVASLALFASVMMLFFYILRIVLEMNRNR